MQLKSQRPHEIWRNESKSSREHLTGTGATELLRANNLRATCAYFTANQTRLIYDVHFTVEFTFHATG